jgi:hypothetical protein
VLDALSYLDLGGNNLNIEQELTKVLALTNLEYVPCMPQVASLY